MASEAGASHNHRLLGVARWLRKLINDNERPKLVIVGTHADCCSSVEQKSLNACVHTLAVLVELISGTDRLRAQITDQIGGSPDTFVHLQDFAKAYDVVQLAMDWVGNYRSSNSLKNK